MTREEQHDLGQQIVDTIGGVGGKSTDITFNEVLELLCSVLAHYIAALPEPLRQQVHNEFGANLAQQIERTAATDNTAHVSLIKEEQPN